MKMRLIGFLLVGCLGLFAGCGCDTNGDGKVSTEEVLEKVNNDVLPAVEKAVEAAEPAIQEVEKVTGGVVTEKQKEKGTSILKGVEDAAKSIGEGAKAGGLESLFLIMTTLASIAGIGGTVLERRKTKAEKQKTKKVGVAAVNAADALPKGQGAGRALADAAKDQGVADFIGAIHSRAK